MVTQLLASLASKHFKLIISFLSVLLLAQATASADIRFPSSDGEGDYFKSLMKDDFEKILAKYAFIGDFRTRPLKRENSSEIFWKYNFDIPDVKFPLPEKFDDFEKMIPRTMGSSRGVEHINRGRVYFLNGDYEKARTTWLTGRKFVRSSEFLNRRFHFFIGIVYLKLGYMNAKKLGPNHGLTTADYSNATTFLGTAYRPPMNVKDEVLDRYTARVFYTLAGIYHNYGKFPQAYQTATEGLDYLRKTGEKTYRHELRRMVAESLILNQSYDEAVREIDIAIRQDPNPAKAASDFARVGDIYFGLNNYELAEDIYGLAIAIDKDLKLVSSQQALLRGESLFWKGEMDEAEKMFQYGIKGNLSHATKENVDDQSFRLARLRIADIYLHRASILKGEKRKKMLDKAKLKYFQVSQSYSGTVAGKYAELRSSCLELPFYEGNNVIHTRKFLKSVEDNFDYPKEARELAMACYVGSFTQRERTKRMLDEVENFSQQYPSSRFLKGLIEPVREVQASKLDTLFLRNKPMKAIAFYEANRQKLFKKGVSVQNQHRLFNAYFNKGDSDKAREFWEGYKEFEGQTVENTPVAEEFRRLTFLEEAAVIDNSFKKELAEQTAMMSEFSGEDLSRVDAFLLTRIKLADDDLTSLPILLKHVSANAQKSVKYLCEHYSPTVSAYIEKEPSKDNLEMLEKDVEEIVENNYVKLAKEGYKCADALLDLEYRIFAASGKQLKYAELWSARTSWPLNKEVLSHIWQASEIFEKNNKSDKAIKIWSYLKEKGPKGAIEVKLAAARLEKEKTALQDLWQ